MVCLWPSNAVAFAPPFGEAAPSKEPAMSSPIAQVNLAVSGMKGITGREEGDLSRAIDDLKDLAQRAKRL